MPSTDEEFDSLVSAVEGQGWRAEVRSDGRVFLYGPDDKSTVASVFAVGDRRGLRNLVAQARRHGFIWRAR